MTTIIKDFTSVAEKYALTFEANLFTIDYNDSDKVSAFLKDKPQFYKTAAEIMLGKVAAPPSVAADLLDRVISISQYYTLFKNAENPSDQRCKLLLDILQSYVDILSLVDTLELERKLVIGFVLNVVVKNGFFNFLTSGENSRIKVLRNVRAHNNVIMNLRAFNTHINRLSPILQQELTRAELRKLGERVRDQEEVLLFDMNKKNIVNFILRENPLLFLKKLITLCHILLYMLGLNKRIILSREIFQNYWQVKYPELAKISVELLLVTEHQRILAEALAAHSPKQLNLTD